MSLPRNNPVVFVTEHAPLSTFAFVVCVVLPLVVIGVALLWAHFAKEDE